MPVKIEFIPEVPAPIQEVFLRSIIEQTLREALPRSFLEREIAVNSIAVSSEKIRELNKTYLDKDAVTDILSFGEYANQKALLAAPRRGLFLGELFFCPEYILEAARDDGVTIKREMAYIIAHGMLHLLGFDHGDEMFALQDRITDALAPSGKD